MCTRRKGGGGRGEVEMRGKPNENGVEAKHT